MQRHLPSLRCYVRAQAGPFLRARESASDLVQSTCRELCESIGSLEFRDDSSFRGWLFTLAWNKIRSRYRHHLAERRHPAREQRSLDAGPGLVEELYSGFLSPSGRASMREEVERLEAAFDRLPPDQREVLALARFAELPHAEIAERIGKTPQAARSLLYRAIARLSGELRRMEDDEPATSP